MTSTMYANKVNGFTVSPAESVTSQFEYILVSTTVPILVNGVVSGGATGSVTSQAALDKLIEIVSMRGQPVVLGAPVYDGSTYYTMRFANEHIGSWLNTGTGTTNAASNVLTLVNSIGAQGIDFGFTTSNVTVTFSTGL